MNPLDIYILPQYFNFYLHKYANISIKKWQTSTIKLNFCNLFGIKFNKSALILIHSKYEGEKPYRDFELGLSSHIINMYY